MKSLKRRVLALNLCFLGVVACNAPEASPPASFGGEPDGSPVGEPAGEPLGDDAGPVSCEAVPVADAGVFNCSQLEGTEACATLVAATSGDGPERRSALARLSACGTCDPRYFAFPADCDLSACGDSPTSFPDAYCFQGCGDDVVMPPVCVDGQLVCTDSQFSTLGADCPADTCWGFPSAIGELCVDGRYTCELPGLTRCDGSVQCTTCEGDWSPWVSTSASEGEWCHCRCSEGVVTCEPSEEAPPSDAGAARD